MMNRMKKMVLVGAAVSVMVMSLATPAMAAKEKESDDSTTEKVALAIYPGTAAGFIPGQGVLS